MASEASPSIGRTAPLASSTVPDWFTMITASDVLASTAASVLRGVGRTDLALDAVQDAMTSLMASPPVAAVV